MHRVTINGTTYDLCNTAVAKLFESGSVTTRGGGPLLLERYTMAKPLPRLSGTVNYCDVHGSSDKCP